MRRFAFGFLAVLAIAGLVLTAGCQRDRSLRVASINEGAPLLSDLVDFGEVVIQEPGEDPEIYPIAEVPTDIVPIEFQYVEIGLGLPTWTPYWANIEKATITYTNMTTGETYEAVQVGMSGQIESDPTGGTTEQFSITIAPGNWKALTFEDDLQDSPEDDDYGTVAVVKAHVEVEGHDYVSNKTVKATKEFDITFGNYWDEPSRLGQ